MKNPKMKPIRGLSERFIAVFWSHVDGVGTSECWPWTGPDFVKGYGRHRGYRAHRVAYTLAKGDIPEGLTIDHLCRNRACCNPAHMEPVTQAVNVLRSDGPCAQHARKTHCSNGHEFTADNTRTRRGGRECRQCIKQWDATSWKRGTRSRGKNG